MTKYVEEDNLRNVNEEWENLKSVIRKIATEIVGKEKNWIAGREIQICNMDITQKIQEKKQA